MTVIHVEHLSTLQIHNLSAETVARHQGLVTGNNLGGCSRYGVLRLFDRRTGFPTLFYWRTVLTRGSSIGARV